ncbi:MAG: amidohydrolase family protein [Proteobacteria bacterium]|nr:amidohydrolase family protein [Pseudomonadota bacterium]
MKTIAPPDPDTRRPEYRAPPGSCDAHCHVFGPADVFPYASTRKYTPPDAPKEKLRQLHDTLGLERAVIVQASCHGTDNSAMLDAIAASDGRYRGVCNADDSFTESQFAELHAGGIRGVRFNFVKHLGGAPDLDKMRAIIEKVRHLPWHVELHFDAKDLLEYESVLDEIPLPVVIDHMGRAPVVDGVGQAPFQSLLSKLRNSENLWVKVSGSERLSTEGAPFSDALVFARACIDAAPDRVIWGTDWPHPNVKVMPNDGDLVDLIPQMAPTIDLQRQLLVDNPVRLFGF